jgi:hypothetical protein
LINERLLTNLAGVVAIFKVVRQAALRCRNSFSRYQSCAEQVGLHSGP